MGRCAHVILTAATVCGRDRDCVLDIIANAVGVGVDRRGLSRARPIITLTLLHIYFTFLEHDT